MKRLIMCAVMSVGSALAGMFGVSGYIEADAVTGVQSQQLAQVVADFAVEPLLRIQGDVDGTNYVDAMRAEFYTTDAASQAKIVALQEGTNAWNAAAALAATALQPSWAATGTVANAQRLVSADGSLIWTEIENGTNWQYCVTNSANVYVSCVSGAGYNGPPVGTAMFGGPDAWVDAGMLATYLLSWDETISAWQLLDLFEYYQWIDVPSEFSLPKSLGGSCDGVGTLTIDWVPVTNRTALATQTDTAILISEHNESTGASIHPTLPRLNDVVNIVGAATDPLLSKAEAAATYLPLANIPGPGCTDLGTSNYFDVSGSTIYYRGTMSGISTATVTKAVSEGWTYALTVVGTNTLIISNAALLNTWTPGGTNTYVFTPSTTNAWEVRGMTP